MPRFALLLAYDGGDFAGWWRQPGRRSVASELDAACERLGEAGAQAVGCARTDAGVHALGQVAHIDCHRAWDPARLAAALDSQLPPDCCCRAAAAVDENWHACHGALGKTYRYRCDVGAQRSPFLWRTSWRPPGGPPTMAALREAAAPLVGQLDCSALSRRGEHRQDLCCDLQQVDWQRQNEVELLCTISGQRFIYRLVRSLVGMMLAAARQPDPATLVRAALTVSGHPLARQQAPARGLCLEEIRHIQPPAWRRPHATKHGLPDEVP